MSFALGFYSFGLTINDTARGVYAAVRSKIARHPDESLERLYARVLTYAHRFEEGLALTPGPFEPKLPTACKQDPLSGVQIWLQCGCPSYEKIQKALKAHKAARFYIYFLDPTELDHFCHYLRGAKSNWAERINFFLLDPLLLGQLAVVDKTSSQWVVTIVDNTMYLVFDDREFETVIEPIDIWERFQISLLNPST